MATYRVILAEDDVTVGDLLAANLEATGGYNIQGRAATGSEALRLTLRWRPDLLLTDMMLPEINAATLAMTVINKCPKTRICVMTSHHQEDLILPLLQSGVHGFIEKTSPLTVMLEAIRTVAGGGVYYSPSAAALLPKLKQLRQQRKSGAEAKQGKLSQRELQVLQLVAEGCTSKEIADRLGISKRTVDNHRTNLHLKLKVKESAGMVRAALRMGLIALPPA